MYAYIHIHTCQFPYINLYAGYMNIRRLSKKVVWF